MGFVRANNKFERVISAAQPHPLLKAINLRSDFVALSLLSGTGELLSTTRKPSVRRKTC
jgi:hypothetical protein